MTIDPWADIPAVKRLEEVAKELRERQRTTPSAPSPEEAASRVVQDAVSRTHAGESMPADVGERAAKAFIDALAPHYNAVAVHLANRQMGDVLKDIKRIYGEEALEALDADLQRIMDEVRTIVARSGRITDGDAAIAAGPQGVEDYSTLRKLASDVAGIRRTAHSIFSATGSDSVLLTDAYRKGMDEVTGVRALGLPDGLVDAVSGKSPRGVAYVIALAESGRAWVPGSVEALEAERTMVDAGVSADAVDVLSVRETPIPTPRPPRPQPEYPHSERPAARRRGSN
ncbi:hypothetical protein [Streptomyces sp. NPDC088733]|uniref:hypothetical protein n=1 Tax=Streptomyces sp. NPDC088733 TaxID=3365880 RepID=UPI0037FA457A